MADDPILTKQARADTLLASLRQESQSLRTVLDGALARTRQRYQRSRSSGRRPVNDVEARILRREFGWTEALGNDQEDRDVRSASAHLKPRIRLLQQAAFDICDRNQPTAEALSQLDAQVKAISSSGAERGQRNG